MSERDRPVWDGAPSYATHQGMDETGRWWWFATEPDAQQLRHLRDEDDEDYPLIIMWTVAKRPERKRT